MARARKLKCYRFQYSQNGETFNQDIWDYSKHKARERFKENTPNSRILSSRKMSNKNNHL